MGRGSSSCSEGVPGDKAAHPLRMTSTDALTTKCWARFLPKYCSEGKTSTRIAAGGVRVNAVARTDVDRCVSFPQWRVEVY